MRLTPLALFIAIFALGGFSARAECVNDYRSNKNAGILITDFTITGTQTISTTDLARITREMIGSCFDENSEEMEERVRASFQDRGYFAVEVKSLRFKPRDPLGVPKAVTLEGEVSEGARYKLAEITFVENHALSSETLRQQFPLKRGDLFERGKVATGLQSLRKLYGTHGFLDSTAIPETTFGSNATANLNISIQEGPQYHMGKLETVGDKQLAAKLGAEWNLAEGDVYDRTYIDQFLEVNRDSLPVGFSRANVQTIQNCPDALVEVRLILDPAEETSHAEPKNVPCEHHHDVSK
jgi:outer membrane protein assembly factor BamA